MMVREYLEQNVYEALRKRLKFIFEEFDNIYISFSGGKDSGGVWQGDRDVDSESR